MATAFLAFGSNLGDRFKNINDALKELSNYNINVTKLSSVIETEPVGGPKQGKYLNAVAEVSTHHSPEQLLSISLSIEKKLGRIRSVKNGPRTLDIDILLYDNIQLKTDELTIPHPRMLERKFVMNPLNEIAPDVCKNLANENYYKN